MLFEEFVEKQRIQWRSQGLERSLRAASGIDFCSNDYLSLSQSVDLQNLWLEDLKHQPLGSTGSRLLRGHHPITDELEQSLAQWGQAQSALFFPSGYQANLALLSTVLKEEAIVFADERIHASMIDGIRLSRAPKFIWQHNDLDHLESLLKEQTRAGTLHFVCVESVYSMTGRLAPLRELVELCESFSAHLIVDEAHAVGLFGSLGQGRVVAEGLQSRVFARIHTAGKAFGSSGAWILGPRSLREFLIQKARGFIYSTAPMPAQQRMVHQTLQYFSVKGPDLMASFQQQQSGFQEALDKLAVQNGVQLMGRGSPISSLIVGDNHRAVQLAQFCQQQGLDVRAIRPPTVPQGESLLRITCPLARSRADQDQLLRALREGLER